MTDFASIHSATASSEAPTGRFVKFDGEDFYEIVNYDRMPPFLMSVVSAGDHWMYLSSTGGLTAGRVSAEHCLFPYRAVDRLHDCYSHTGPTTVVRRRDASGEFTFWQPFVDRVAGPPSGPRRLLKHVAGDQVIFEEVNDRLGLSFRYGWRTSAKFGFVRLATLENVGHEDVELDLVDGLQNLWPGGVPLSTFRQASCLVDAYKHNELDPTTGLGIYSLTAQILDRAEAAEVLRATTVWRHGLPDGVSFLSTDGLRAFSAGETPVVETLCTGRRGNYFTFATVRLGAGETNSWSTIADVRRDHQQVASIRQRLANFESIDDALSESIRQDRERLLRNIASADGLQATNSRIATAHHFANVLFNNMRGGIFATNYSVDSSDLIDFIKARNSAVAASEQTLLLSLPTEIDYPELLTRARAAGNVDLTRLTMEYLPLTFGRRHGDPSRPWNAFEIRVLNDDGSRIYNYQGNWRDIFQNWEALTASFPEFLPSIVAKFVNASTIDGFNPYRITRDGVDWEAPDPEDPWSNIGYWGDHQIIYLTKLLEALRDRYPGTLEKLFESQVFCYANVPYRIKSFDEIVANSSATIDFDQFTAQEIDRRVDAHGADGTLVHDAHGKVYHVNLIEKLVVPVLAKLSNLVVDGGIWLNTQRPEWNDANNALVGSGLSMVTVCYLRRHLKLLVELLRDELPGNGGDRRVAVSVEVEQWFRKIRDVLKANRPLLHQPTLSDEDRGRILAAVGRAFSEYRLKVYDEGFTGKHTIGCAELVDFLGLSAEYLDHSIRANRRDDRLYHAYNLLELGGASESAKVDHLYEMLEGQVAVLSSGVLDAGQAVELVDAMFASQLYRDDQRSFMLYPNRRLPGFLERNQIPSDKATSIELLQKLVEVDERSVVVRDGRGDDAIGGDTFGGDTFGGDAFNKNAAGNWHFAADNGRQADLQAALDQLALDGRWSELVARDRQRVLDLFDEVFHHKTYTGRSGTMYGYEGLGCIYWHMASKLLLAIQENLFHAVDRQASSAVIESLADAYYLVRGGLSSDKTPAEYGAFPADPYSHTPMHSGAQQPGMTGQVKEEILTRQGELGVRVVDGRVRFEPLLLRRREFFDQPAEFRYFDLSGDEQRIELPERSLAFTYCQTPIVYELINGPLSVAVIFGKDKAEKCGQDGLDAEMSQKLFARTGEIARIDVKIPNGQIARA